MSFYTDIKNICHMLRSELTQPPVRTKHLRNNYVESDLKEIATTEDCSLVRQKEVVVSILELTYEHGASNHFRGVTKMVWQFENSVVKDFFTTARDGEVCACLRY